MFQLKGYKVTDVNRTRKFGVACRSLQELKRKACAKLNVSISASIDAPGISIIDRYRPRGGRAFSSFDSFVTDENRVPIGCLPLLLHVIIKVAG